MYGPLGLLMAMWMRAIEDYDEDEEDEEEEE
jgi:hypothetical protein